MKNSIESALEILYDDIKDDLKNGYLEIGILNTLMPVISNKCVERMARNFQVKKTRFRVIGSTKECKKKTHSWLTEAGRQKWRDDWDKKVKEKVKFTQRMRQMQKEIYTRKQREHARMRNDLEVKHVEKSSHEMIQILNELKAKRNQEKLASIEKKRQERLGFLPELQQNKKSMNEKKSILHAIQPKVYCNEMEKSTNNSEIERKYKEILKKYSQDEQEMNSKIFSY